LIVKTPDGEDWGFECEKCGDMMWAEEFVVYVNGLEEELEGLEEEIWAVT
jgi:transcription initiation factor IIE alpha subunit